MAVFLPVGFMGGIVGRFMSSFGLTAVFAIAISLLLSFTLTPMLASKLIKPEDTDEAIGSSEVEESDALQNEIIHDDSFADEEDVRHARPEEKHGGDSKDFWWYRPIDQTYTWLLKLSMAHRWAIVVLCCVVIASMIPLFMMVDVNFTPTDDQSEFEVSVRTMEGSTLAATTTVLDRIARDIKTLPGITDTLVTVGGGAQGAVNSGGIYIRLKPIEERDISQQDLMTKTRELLQAIRKN